jgi:photosystem II stability/assembly factor-like uncharacterized protein
LPPEALVPDQSRHRIPQPDVRGEIEVFGGRAFAISPNGEIWVGSSDGRLYVSRDWNETWTEVQVSTHRPDEFGSGGDQLEQLRFFDAQHAILAGYIGGDEKDEILRTEDGGRTWNAVKLPKALWVYDAHVLPDGHAWLVGSTGKLLSSDDYGATWCIAGSPFDGASRSGTVCFISPTVGVVGSAYSALTLTRDGGRTWAPIKTPAEVLSRKGPLGTKGRRTVYVTDENGNSEFREEPPGAEDKISRIWIVGGRLFAMQRDAIYECPLEETRKWTSFEVGGHKVVNIEPTAGGLVALTDERMVHLLSPTLERIGGSRLPLSDHPLAIAAHQRGLAFLTDQRGEVCLLEGADISCSRMYSVGATRTWPITAFDRTRDGTLFGVSSRALYRSIDSGHTWERLVEADGFSAVHASDDAATAVVGGPDGMMRWHAGSSRLEPIEIPGGDEVSPSIALRHGHLWISMTFDATDDEEVQRMLITSDTVLVGPGFTAFVFASADEGRTWRRVDRYKGAVVHALWLGADDILSVCMSDGSIRRGHLDPTNSDAWPPELEMFAGPGNYRGGEFACWIAFPGNDEGWLGSMNFFGGGVAQHSVDGGRTWAAFDPPSDEMSEVFLLGGGACVRLTEGWDEPTRVEAWQAGAFNEIRTFPPRVHDAVVDSTGSLLVRLPDAEVWCLEADARTWVRVGSIPLPPR